MKKLFLLAGVAFALWSILRRATAFDSMQRSNGPSPGSADRPNIEELADRLQHGWADQHHTQA